MVMNIDSSKGKKLTKLKPKQYRIYGIFSFETKELVFVHMNMEKVTFEFDLEGYNESKFGIISFDVWLGN